MDAIRIETRTRISKKVIIGVTGALIALAFGVALAAKPSLFKGLLGRGDVSTCTLDASIARAIQGQQIQPNAQQEQIGAPGAAAGKLDDNGAAPALATDRAPQRIQTGEIVIRVRDEKVAKRLAEARLKNGALDIDGSDKLNTVLRQYCVTNLRRQQSLKDADGEARVKLGNIFLLRTPQLAAYNDEGVRMLQSALRQSPDILSASPNSVMTIATEPNDTYYGTTGSWNQAYRDLWGVQTVQANAVWETAQGQDVVVAVVDTGIDFTHPDFYPSGVEADFNQNYAQSNVWTNAGEIGTDGQSRDKRTNGVDDDGNGYVDDWKGMNFYGIYGEFMYNNDPTDDHGHGTHVSGTIAAAMDNGRGIVGVAPRVKIMPLKFLGDNGSGSSFDALSAITYAVNMGARVINASWGGSGQDDSSDAIDALLLHEYWTTPGTLLVAAAGNESLEICGSYLVFPACPSWAVTVAATDAQGARANFTNWGSRIDVAAPGVDTLSLRAAGTDMYGDGKKIVGQQYLRASGTSMAAPHVAGVAALIRGLAPNLPAYAVREILRAAAHDVGQVGKDSGYGYGMVDAAAAIGRVRQFTTDPKPDFIALEGSAHVSTDSRYFSVDLYVSNIGPTKRSTYIPWNVYIGDQPSGRLACTYTGPWPWEGIPFQFSWIGCARTLQAGEATPTAVTFVLDPGNIEQEYNESNNTLTVPVLEQSEAWPRGAYGAYPYGSPLIADLNRDGLLDVFLATAGGFFSSPATIWSSLGWPETSYWGHPSYGTGAVADLDGDGYTEVVVASDTTELGGGWGELRGTVSAYRTDGTMSQPPSLLWERRMADLSQFKSSPAVGDIDGDGRPEVVVSGYDFNSLPPNVQTHGSITVFQGEDGTDAPGWPKYNLQRVFGSPALGDLDGDGKLDVVVGTFDGKVYAWKGDGSPVPGWEQPKQAGDRVYTTVAIGDIAGDVQPEVIVSSNDGKVYAWDHAGNALAGWPKATGNGLRSSPALGDLDQDDKLDVVVGSLDTKVYAWKGDGSSVPGWEQPKETGGEITSSPALGDLNGDGRLDVVIGSWSKKLFAWSGAGDSIAGWPKETAIAMGTSPVIADLEGDGKLDVVYALPHFGQLHFIWMGLDKFYYNENLYVISQPWTSSADPRPWPTFHHDNQRTGVLASTAASPTVDIASPAANAFVRGTVQVQATTQPSAVDRVEFYHDGTTLLGTDASSPYTYDWNTATAADGSHTLTAKAYAGSVSGTSTTITVTVDNTVPSTPTNLRQNGPITLGMAEPAPQVVNGVTVAGVQIAREEVTPPGDGSGGGIRGKRLPLAWDASTDTGSGVAGYKLYFCYASTYNCTPNTAIDVKNVTAYAASIGVIGQHYVFEVSAYDYAGNESGRSNQVKVDL